jgi:hypothetical protein
MVAPQTAIIVGGCARMARILLADNCKTAG